MFGSIFAPKLNFLNNSAKNHHSSLLARRKINKFCPSLNNIFEFCILEGTVLMQYWYGSADLVYFFLLWHALVQPGRA